MGTITLFVYNLRYSPYICYTSGRKHPPTQTIYYANFGCTYEIS